MYHRNVLLKKKWSILLLNGKYTRTRKKTCHVAKSTHSAIQFTILIVAAIHGKHTG